VCELFSWKEIHCEFSAGTPQTHLFPQDELSQKIRLLPDALVMEAARRMDELEVIRESLPSARDVLVVVQAPNAAPGSPQAELVGLIDGIRDIEEVLAKVHKGKFRAMKTLKILADKGIVRLKSATELFETGSDLKDQRGNARHGGVTKIIKLFERAEELGLKSQRMSLWLAKAYERTKQKKQSVTRYLALGRESLAAGNVEQGVTFYRRILELNPEDHEAHQNLIAALLKQGQIDEAIEELSGLTQRLKEVGKTDKALEIAKATKITVGDAPAVRELIAGLTFDAGDHIQALMDLETVALDYTDDGKLEEAVRVYERMLEIDAENIDAHFKLAGALTELGRTGEAVDRYKTLADTLSQSGVLESSINWTFLITVYEQIVAIEPSNRVAREWLADAYRSKDEMPKALGHCNELVRILGEAGEHDALIATLQKILEMQPQSAQARRRLSEAYVAINDRPAAVAQLRAVGEEARQRGENEAAYKALTDAILIDPFEGETHADYAELLLATGRPVEAAATFRDLAHLARAARRFEEAARWFDRAAVSDPNDAQSLGEAGDVLAATGDLAGAADAYRRQAERALELQNMGDARRAVQKLTQVAPNDGALPDLKARAGAA
jgi:tetratricopeptide (TPR) repeat protein